MHGILRPQQSSYSPLATGERRVNFAQQQQQQQQQQQWPRATPESYTASYAPYQTPSQQQAQPYTADMSAQMNPPYQQQSTPTYQTSASAPATAYTNPAYPSTMAHSTPSSYPGYSPDTNNYQYPSATPASSSAPPARTFDESPAGDESDSQSQPRKRQRTSNNVYGLKYNFSAPDVEALIEALGVDIRANSGNPEPECTSTELSLDDSALVPLLRPAIGPYSLGGEQDIPEDFDMSYPDPPAAESQSQSQGQSQGETQTQTDSETTQQTSSTQNPSQSQSQTQPPYVPPSRRADSDNIATAPRATVQSTLQVPSYKSRSIVQRAASRGIIQAIENLDGYKYSFNNAWSAKDQDGYRFSYICQDSMQNKDRHANGFLRTQKFLKKTNPQGGQQDDRARGPRKETYDCKGSVSVKFSAKVGKVVVQYRHCAIHGTVAERKPPPRKPSGILGFGGIRAQATPRSEETKRRRRMGDAVQVLPATGMAPPPRAGREPSLFDLLCQSADADDAAAKKAGDVG